MPILNRRLIVRTLKEDLRSNVQLGDSVLIVYIFHIIFTHFLPCLLMKLITSVCELFGWEDIGVLTLGSARLPTVGLSRGDK